MAPSRFTALASHTPDSTATDSASKSTKYQEIVRDEFIYACAAGCLNAAIRVLRYNPTTCFLTEIDIAFKCALAGSHWSILKWMWAQNENVGANDLADDTYTEYTDKVITLDEINYMNKLRTLREMNPIVGYVPKKRVSSTPAKQWTSKQWTLKTNGMVMWMRTTDSNQNAHTYTPIELERLGSDWSTNK